MIQKKMLIYLILILFFVFFFSGCSFKIGKGDREWHDFVSPHSKLADMGNYKMHYLDIGKGKPIVLVHGFSDSTYCWHNNIYELLDAGFRLIIVDQPGMGKSGIPPEPYTFSIENQAKEIIKLTEKLDLKEFSLIGHSMGGGIALYISSFFPQKVMNTIAIDPACFRLPKRILLTYPGMTHIASVFAGRWSVKMALKDVYYNDDKVDDILIDEYTRPMVKPNYVKMLVSLAKQYFSDEFDRMVDHYDKMNIPLLIIWGKHDKWIPVEYGIKLNEITPNSQLVILNNCGHNSHQECSAGVNSGIMTFYDNDDNE
ncbi:MAG: alpha/beta hydrolase [Deltaproteobacteria bacterium]|nr:alpha/beta hydrolase [Deltaproteobacteria bacterium]